MDEVITHRGSDKNKVKSLADSALKNSENCRLKCWLLTKLLRVKVCHPFIHPWLSTKHEKNKYTSKYPDNFYDTIWPGNFSAKVIPLLHLSIPPFIILSPSIDRDSQFVSDKLVVYFLIPQASKSCWFHSRAASIRTNFPQIAPNNFACFIKTEFLCFVWLLPRLHLQRNQSNTFLFLSDFFWQFYNGLCRNLPRRYVLPLTVDEMTPPDHNLVTLPNYTATAKKTKQGEVGKTRKEFSPAT